MSVKWTCDYPECTKLSEKHEDWLRTEDMQQREWWEFAIPIIGIVIAIVNATDSDANQGIPYIRHYCPTHAKFLRRDKS